MTNEEYLATAIADCCRDPSEFVKIAYPWGEPGDLADETGPWDWQREILNDIRVHLNSSNRYIPLQLAVASGHGIGKSALQDHCHCWHREATRHEDVARNHQVVQARDQ